MALDAGNLAVIRQWCGSAVGSPDAAAFDAADIEARLDRLGTAEKVALEVLGQVRADFLIDPASLTLVGDYSHDTSANLRALDARIAELQRLVGDPAGQIAVLPMVRDSARR